MSTRSLLKVFLLSCFLFTFIPNVWAQCGKPADRTGIHAGAYDFNGDGIKDMILRNRVTSRYGIWLMAGDPVPFQVDYFQGSENLLISAIGDLNGDRKTDIVWRDTRTGDIQVMDGVTRQALIEYKLPDPDWQIVGSGDLDGDGMLDLIWRHGNSGDVVEWLMEGTGLKSWSALFPGLDLDWQLSGVGDIDGDGKSDLIWRHATSGDVVNWLMDGSMIKGWSELFKGLPREWQLCGVGDIDGDSRADLLWRNVNSGDVVDWLMNGSTIKAWSTLAAGLYLRWVIKGVGDVNGDGRGDLLWQNTDSGEISTWLMDGSSVKKWFPIRDNGPGDPPFTVLSRTDSLTVTSFTVPIRQFGSQNIYTPLIRVMEPTGKVGLTITRLDFSLGGVPGGVPSINLSTKVEAGGSANLNNLGAYDDYEFELISQGAATGVTVTISFTDDTGRTGTTAIQIASKSTSVPGPEWEIQ